MKIQELTLSSTEPFISGLLSTILIEDSQLQDIYSSENSIFLSADSDTFINVTSCTFNNVVATSHFTGSRGMFTFLAGENINGTFVDAETSDITMSYMTFHGFTGDGKSLLQS